MTFHCEPDVCVPGPAQIVARRIGRRCDERSDAAIRNLRRRLSWIAAPAARTDVVLLVDGGLTPRSINTLEDALTVLNYPTLKEH